MERNKDKETKKTILGILLFISLAAGIALLIVGTEKSSNGEPSESNSGKQVLNSITPKKNNIF